MIVFFLCGFIAGGNSLNQYRSKQIQVNNSSPDHKGSNSRRQVRKKQQALPVASELPERGLGSHSSVALPCLSRSRLPSCRWLRQLRSASHLIKSLARRCITYNRKLIIEWNWPSSGRLVTDPTPFSNKLKS